MATYKMGGFVFPQKLFEENIEIFKEGLAHTSLTCEQAFAELYSYQTEIQELANGNSRRRYNAFKPERKALVTRQLRYFIVYTACYKGIIPGGIPKIEDPIVDEIYKENFSYLDAWLYDMIVFDAKGEVDQRATYRKCIELFRVAPSYKQAYDTAHDMKKDHLDAFDYALSLDSIGVQDIIDINAIVKRSDPDKEIGFKKADNIINGASFTPASKESTPTKVSELVHGYNTGFGKVILDPNDPTLTREEKKAAIHALCEREAKFHIDLIRIHPFGDGNGRTARIILNRNLIKNGLAPVLVTDITMNKYKGYIGNANYDEFAEWIMENSSQTLTPWVTRLRIYKRMSNDSLSPLRK